MKITISGFPGSGKTIVGKEIAKELNYEFLSIGDLRRKFASKKNLSILEYNKLKKEDVDTEFDQYQKKYGEKNNDFVLDGRLSFYFVPDSIKIFFKVKLDIAAERIFKDQRKTEKKYESIEETKKNIQKRLDNDCKRYLKLYDLDVFNLQHFDLVIDTSDLTIDQVKEKVINYVKSFSS